MDEVVACAAGRDGEPADVPVAAAEHERGALGRRFDACGELVERERPDRAAEPDRLERPPRASPRSAPRAGRCSRASGARRVPGDTRRATRRRGRGPRAGRADGRRRRAARCARRARGARERAPRRARPPARTARGSTRPARDRRHLVRADDLQALGRELREPLDLEQRARVRDDLVPASHGASLRNRETATLRLGVWRSLVARSVRVGEVPSSNLGTPI